MRTERRYILYELNIDPEYEWLHIPMSEAKRSRLEADIGKNGVLKPLVVWRGYVVDGHKRYEICRRHGLVIPIRNISFDCSYDAMIWICGKNLLRFDLTEEYRKYNIGKMYLLKRDRARDQITGTVSSRYPKNNYPIAWQMGGELKMSHSTVLKYSQYAEAIDMIRKLQPDICKKILNGQIRVSHENVLEISKLSPEDLMILKKSFCEEDRTHFTISEIRHELHWNRIHPATPERRLPPVQHAAIKQMPAYDPDAEISSLALMIPTWRGSMERVRDTANFSAASDAIKKKLLGQLSSLSDTIRELQIILYGGRV